MNPAPAPAGNEGVSPHVVELARALAEAGHGTVRGILLYGSHLLGANPDRHSALDFVVVVRGYRGFYEALRDAGEMHRPPGLMSALSGILPPNVIAFTPDEGRQGIAKCLVVSEEDLDRALGPDAPDHFLQARLIQRVAVVWRAEPEWGEWIEARLGRAHAGVLSWAAPHLEGDFDAEALGRRLLEICYRGEFRPEAKNRSDTIFDAQRDHFRRVLAPVLEQGASEGTLLRVDGRYRLVRPASAADARRWRRYFRRSKARVTARWLKHVVTFDNWLPYIQRKVERRMGRKVELTRLERALPVPFLIPRAVALLFTRPEREDPR